MKKELAYYTIGGALGWSQDWFPRGWMRLGGCAAVAACDVSILLSRDDGITSMYPHDTSRITREAYLEFSEVMRPYLHPRWSGIDSLKIFIDGFGKYIHDVHADEFICLDGIEGTEPWEEARDAIVAEIDRGRAVPFLMLYHQGREFDEYEWHWFNLAGYDDEAEDGFRVKAVTYGNFEWLNLERLWDTGYEKRGGIILVNDR